MALQTSLLFVVPLLLAGAARADTVNMREASSVLDFSVSGARAAGQEGLAALDLDGDGQVSRPEAAGHADFTLGFDRADRNRDGRLSEGEWSRYEKWRERREAARAAREARRAKAQGSASAGTSAKGR